MMTPVLIRKFLMPSGYELLPIEVIEILIDASERGYIAAFGGSQAAVNKAWHAAQAARHVLDRRIAMDAKKSEKP